MHLLVLDGSRVLTSVVRRLAPLGVEVECVATFDDALRRLAVRPPQAMIINLTPADLPWSELQELCQKHSPPIPVLYESCVHSSPVDAGLGALNGSGHFLEKPYALADLRAEIERLVETAARAARTSRDDRPHRPRPQ